LARRINQCEIFCLSGPIIRPYPLLISPARIGGEATGAPRRRLAGVGLLGPAGWVAGCPQQATRCDRRSCQLGPPGCVYHYALCWIAACRRHVRKAVATHRRARMIDRAKLSVVPRGAPTLPCCLPRRISTKLSTRRQMGRVNGIRSTHTHGHMTGAPLGHFEGFGTWIGE
jgi:hypothetical protein